MKGLVSENLNAASYGTCTANAIGKNHPIGHDLSPERRYESDNKGQFNQKKFRRFMDSPEMKPKKDYEDYAKFINDTYLDKKVDILEKSLDKKYASCEKDSRRKDYSKV